MSEVPLYGPRGSAVRVYGAGWRDQGFWNRASLDPAQALGNLNTPQRRVGGAIFGNFPHILLHILSIFGKISKMSRPRTRGPGG